MPGTGLERCPDSPSAGLAEPGGGKHRAAPAPFASRCLSSAGTGARAGGAVCLLPAAAGADGGREGCGEGARSRGRERRSAGAAAWRGAPEAGGASRGPGGRRAGTEPRGLCSPGGFAGRAVLPAEGLPGSTRLRPRSASSGARAGRASPAAGGVWGEAPGCRQDSSHKLRPQRGRRQQHAEPRPAWAPSSLALAVGATPAAHPRLYRGLQQVLMGLWPSRGAFPTWVPCAHRVPPLHLPVGTQGSARQGAPHHAAGGDRRQRGHQKHWAMEVAQHGSECHGLTAASRPPLPSSTRCARRCASRAPDYHLVWSLYSGCNLMLSKLVFTRDKAAIRGLFLFSQ